MKEIKTKTNNNQAEKTAGMAADKAEKIMQDYFQATGCSYCIYDSNYNPSFMKEDEGTPDKTVCPCCPAGKAHEIEPCHDLHVTGIKEAARKGNYHIYKCNLGYLFWASPVYTQGSFSGAVRGGGFINNMQETVDILSKTINNSVMCNNEKSKDDLKERISGTQEADGERVQSLAEMMQLCAESLSTGSEDYHEIIKRRAEQQQAIARIIETLKTQYPPDEKPGYPLEKEKSLMAALRKGDVPEAKRTLNELLAILIFSNPEQFNYIQLRITELVVLISRVEMSPAKSGNFSMEINSQNLKLVQEAKNIEELTDVIHTVVDRVSGSISSFRGIPHAAALRKAENFILENYTKKISLKEIADVAGLSPPYFSTIFKEEMGENLSKYLNRLRVEKASHYLLETDMSLSEIAANCCFEDQSWFSKIFKAYTGVSPGKYRNQGGVR